MRILLDLDSTLNNLLQKWLGDYNADYNDNKTITDIKGWHLHKYVKPECGKDIYKYLGYRGYFSSLIPLPGSKEFVETLRRNHDVCIVTASSNRGPFEERDKLNWVSKHYGFDKYDFITTHSKWLVAGDILIDDGPHNAQEYRDTWPKAGVLTIQYPYNEECGAYDFIAGNWDNTEAAFKSLYDWITDEE